MLQDGILFVDSSVATNFQIQNGTSLPTTGNNVGELFFLTSGTIGLYVYDGASYVAATSAPPAGSVSFNGDATGSGLVGASTFLTLATVNSTVGTFGSASDAVTFSVNAKGLVTSASQTAIAIAASQTTSGTFADARIAASNVTQHQASLTILETQITDGLLLARNAANEVITGSWMFQQAITGQDPSAATHLATKQYVDNVAAGLDPKASVRVATTANIALTGTQTIDGVVLVAGDRVLVKNQSTGSEDGLYIVGSGAWARSADFDGTPASEVTSGAYVFVTEGALNGAKGFVLVTADPITVGTTAQTWTEISAAPTTLAGTALTGTTLASNIVSSSLTSVGTLGSLAVTGGVTAATFTGALVGAVTGNVTGSLLGNADTSTKLATARTINGVAFDGSANVTVTADAGTLTGTSLAATVTGSSLTSVGTLGTLTVTGAITAGSINATVSGNASTATALATGHTFSVSGDATGTSAAFDGTAAATIPVTLATVNATTGTFGTATQVPQVVVNGKGLITSVTNTTIAVPSTAVTDFVEAVQDVVGASTFLSGANGVTSTYNDVANTLVIGLSAVPNASLANPSVTVGTTNIALGATSTTLAGLTSVTSAAFVGPLTGAVTGAVTGNASTATKLFSSVTINGVAFDGSANVTVPAAAATLTGSTLASNVTGSSLTSVGTLTSLTVSGTINGSVSGSAATVTAAAQGNITSLGTLTGLIVSGTSGLSLSTSTPIYLGGGAGNSGQVLTSNGAFQTPSWTTISISAGSLTGTTLASNVTASSLTSVGTLGGLTVGGTSTFNGTMFTGSSAGLELGNSSSGFTHGQLYLSGMYSGLGSSGITIEASGTTGMSSSSTAALQIGYLTTSLASASGAYIGYTGSSSGYGISTGSLVFSSSSTGGIFLRAGGSTRLYIDGSGAWNLNTDSSGFGGSAGQVLMSSGPTFSPSWQSISIAGSGLAGTSLASNIITSSLGTLGTQLQSLNMGGYSVTNAAAPTVGTDLTTKNYVDAAIAGLRWKTSVKAATTANITLSGTQTIDGISLIAGDRVLVKNQTTSSQNGVYVVAAGAWTRSTDADAAIEVDGSAVYVLQGTTLADTGWTETATITTLGTDAVVYAQFSGSGTYTAGTGISLTGNTFANTGVTSLTGTANQVTVSAATGGVTVSLPSAITIAGAMTAGSFSGPLSGAVTGNASTATTLQTARNINGVSFNGSADITVTAAAGTLTGTTLNSTVTASSLTSVGTLASLGVTGTVTAGAFSGPLTGNVTGSASLNVLKAGDTMTGALSISPASGDSNLVLNNAASGGFDLISMKVGGLNRWVIAKDNTAESGLISGSHFSINRYDDAGVYLSTPFSINRTTGNSSFTGIIGSTVNTAGNPSLLNLTNTNTGGGTAVAFSSNNGTVTGYVGALTANSFNVVSTSAAPLVLGTSNLPRLTIDANGFVSIGSVTSADSAIYLSRGITGATLAYGVQAIGAVQSDVTTTAAYFGTTASTVASLALGTLHHFRAAQSTFNASSTVGQQFGFAVSSSLIGAANNYGLYGGLSHTTAAISNVALTSNVVTITTAAAHGYTAGMQVAVTATTNTAVNGTFTITSVTSTTFTYAKTGTNITSVADTGSVTSVGRWNLYAAGTAPNYFAGNVGIGNAAPTRLLSVGNTTDEVGASAAAAVSTLYLGGNQPATGVSTIAYDRSIGTLTISTGVTTGTMTEGLRVAAGVVTVAGTFVNGAAATATTTTSITTTTATAVDSFPTASYRSAKYIVQVTDSTNSQFHAVEILVIHDGSTVYKTEYAEVTSVAALGTFDASITTGVLNLVFTATAATTKTVKVFRTAISL